MRGIVTRIARLAVSKAAAFCYAVAVAVAGNLAFNFVQHHQPPAVLSAPEATGPTGGTAKGHIAATKIIPARLPAASAAPAPSAVSVLPPAAKPAPAQPDPAPPTLPEPPAVALPSLDSLPAPALKPAALQPAPVEPAAPAPHQDAARSLKQTAPVSGEAARPREATVPARTATDRRAAPGTASAASPGPSAPAALPPLAPAVEVAPRPTPPALLPATASAPVPRRIAPATASGSPERSEPAAAESRSWELSDIWHPGRIVERGLHWAGKQLPAIGGDAATPPFPQPPPSAAPIPLVPPAAWPAASEKPGALAPPHKAVAPGPGSGGLY